MQSKLFPLGCEELSLRARGSEPDKLHYSVYFVRNVFFDS